MIQSMTSTQEHASKKTMKAVQGKELGDIDEMLTVEDHVPLPNLGDLPAKKKRTKMIIQTKAVALACGDCRVLSGLTRELQGPPSFPYIPGGDCAGIVLEIPREATDNDDALPFQVGDRVAVRFVEGPRGALAEYAVVDTRVCEKIPDNISFEEGAVLASVSPATLLGERIREGERVLVLGAGGGVGSHTCQVMRKQGAAYLVGVSKNLDRLLQSPLNYDRAIDYTKQDPFSLKEYKDNPFDTVVDLAGGSWLRLIQDYNNKEKSIVKPASQGGRFLTLTPDQAIFEAHSVWAVMKPFLFIPIWRAIKSRTWGRRRLPKYTFAFSLDNDRNHLTRTMEMAQNGTLKACIDPRGPFPFSTEGVRKAFRLQETRHVNGKVVVTLSDKGEKK
ncbi:alcohol dehydrogenase [Nitzschia inconspicua]|uniref:Alcohol dehydrogenase n=1 Tax=Nitzschia inconspicua TaxID=303405 RepID=A0A9K3LGS4_9STRA|nr:alcohol dehydrogenase [Nitzschia inconspicua]